MANFITKAFLLFLVAVTAEAYNPQDPQDPVMYVRRLRADSRSLNNNGGTDIKMIKRPPCRTLKTEKHPRKGRNPARRELNRKRTSNRLLSSNLSCAGGCGESLAGCWCDAVCQNYGDCCDDVCDECGFCEPVATFEPSIVDTVIPV